MSDIEKNSGYLTDSDWSRMPSVWESVDTKTRKALDKDFEDMITGWQRKFVKNPPTPCEDPFVMQTWQCEMSYQGYVGYKVVEYSEWMAWQYETRDEHAATETSNFTIKTFNEYWQIMPDLIPREISLQIDTSYDDMISAWQSPPEGEMSIEERLYYLKAKLDELDTVDPRVGNYWYVCFLSRSAGRRYVEGRKKWYPVDRKYPTIVQLMCNSRRCWQLDEDSQIKTKSGEIGPDKMAQEALEGLVDSSEATFEELLRKLKENFNIVLKRRQLKDLISRINNEPDNNL